jgi:hypothetical protein
VKWTDPDFVILWSSNKTFKALSLYLFAQMYEYKPCFSISVCV